MKIIRDASEMFDRPIKQLAELAIAEAGHAFFAKAPHSDPANGLGVFHPFLQPREAL